MLPLFPLAKPYPHENMIKYLLIAFGVVSEKKLNQKAKGIVKILRMGSLKIWVMIQIFLQI